MTKATDYLKQFGIDAAPKKRAARKTNPAPKPSPFSVHWKSRATGNRQTTSAATKAKAFKEAAQLYREGATNISVTKYSPGIGAVELNWRVTLRNRNPAPKLPVSKTHNEWEFFVQYAKSHAVDQKTHWSTFCVCDSLLFAEDVAKLLACSNEYGNNKWRVAKA